MKREKSMIKSKKRFYPGFNFLVVFLMFTFSISLFSREKFQFGGNFFLGNHNKEYGKIFYPDNSLTLNIRFSLSEGGYFKHSGSIQESGLRQALSQIHHSRMVDDINVERARVGPGKIVFEIIAGLAGNISLGYMGLMLGVTIEQALGSSDDDSLTGLFGGYLIGSNIGTTLGVWAVGNSNEVKGSFYKAWLGTLLGQAIAFGIFYFATVVYDDLDRYGDTTWPLYLCLIAPPVCSTILFNTSLRYKNLPENGNALLNIRQGRLRPGIPLFSVQPLPDYRKLGKMAFRFNVNVLSIQL